MTFRPIQFNVESTIPEESLEDLSVNQTKKPLSLFKRTKDFLGRVVKKRGEAVEKTMDETEALAPYLAPGAKTFVQSLNLAGQTAGGVLDIVGKGVEKGIEAVGGTEAGAKLGNLLMNVINSGARFLVDNPVTYKGLEAINKGIDKWSVWKEENPTEARSIESSVNLGLLYPGFKAGNVGIGAAERVGAVVGEKIGGIGGAIEKQALKQELKTKQTFVRELVKSPQTKKVLEEQIGRTSESGWGPFKKSQIVPSFEEAMAEKAVMTVEGISEKNTFQGNYNIIKEANVIEAKWLEAKVGINDYIVPKKQVFSRAKFAIDDLKANHPLITNANYSSAERVLNGWDVILKKNEGKASGVLKARKEFDRWIENLPGGEKMLDPNTETAVALSVKAIRRSSKELLVEKAPTIPIKESYERQTNLFTAMENIGPKAASQADTYIKRSFQRIGELIGIKSKVIQGTAGALGLGSLGALAGFMPAVAATAIGGFVLFKAGKLILNPRLRVWIGRALQEVEKITIPKDPIKLQQFQADKQMLQNLWEHIKNPKIGLTIEDVSIKSSTDFNNPAVGETASAGAKALREAKGLSASDIMVKHPDIVLKRDVPATDIYGKKVKIPEGEALTPYELKGNKVLLQDGETYIVSKNQYQNIKGNAVSGEAKSFAPELEGTEETVKGGNYADWKQRMESKYGKSFNEKIPDEERQIGLRLLGKKSDTKFSQYQLPGGKNYKEVLIKAPTNETNFNTFNSWLKDQTGKDASALSDVQVEKYRRQYDSKQAPQFNSSHWDEPNVISHLRLNERIYKGKKVTFMEELQSDWAREFRKSGVQAGEDFTVEDIGAGGRVMNTRTKNIGAVPSHPLLKNWQELSVKRALKEAVDNNSEYLAWTTGEQQAARYNLSQELDGISWSSGKGNTLLDNPANVKVNMKVKGGDTIDLIVEKKTGKIVSTSEDKFEGKLLPEAIGKGVAEKILAEPKGNLSGEGLNIGGEWAHNLYDRQVKNIVEDVTGGKVEVLDMGLEVAGKKSDFWLLKDFRPVEKATEKNLKVGKQIALSETAGGVGNTYIITDILGDGKFKAVPKDRYDAVKTVSKERGLNLQEEVNKRLEVAKETFDIFTKKSSGQQGIFLSPRIKSLIRGEAPALKSPSGLMPKMIK